MHIYKALLEEHVMLAMCGATNLSLKEFVTQLIQHNKQDIAAITEAYEHIQTELIGK